MPAYHSHSSTLNQSLTRLRGFQSTQRTRILHLRIRARLHRASRVCRPNNSTLSMHQSLSTLLLLSRCGIQDTTRRMPLVSNSSSSNNTRDISSTNLSSRSLSTTAGTWALGWITRRHNSNHVAPKSVCKATLRDSIPSSSHLMLAATSRAKTTNSTTWFTNIIDDSISHLVYITLTFSRAIYILCISNSLHSRLSTLHVRCIFSSCSSPALTLLSIDRYTPVALYLACIAIRLDSCLCLVRQSFVANTYPCSTYYRAPQFFYSHANEE